MIRRNWMRLLIAVFIGAGIIGTLATNIIFGTLISGGPMWIIWVIWSLTKKPRQIGRILAPFITAGTLFLLGFYALQCYPFLGYAEYWCL